MSAIIDGGVPSDGALCDEVSIDSILDLVMRPSEAVVRYQVMRL